MAPISEDDGWRSIAAQASKEMDDEKLMILVQQLCSAFDECHKPPQTEHVQTSFALEEAS